MILSNLLAAIDVAARELLLFAGIWMAVGLVDELVIEGLWSSLKLRGRGRALRFTPPTPQRLRGECAVFIPCWHEANVIGATLRRCIAVWRHAELRIFVGHYPNDTATGRAIAEVARLDARIEPVVMSGPGPTTKADCLNALYAAMERHERDRDKPMRFVLLHDAEDFVHPDALDLIDDRLERADYVQLPVVPEMHRAGRWIGGHYGDEFAENHLKTMVVRDWLRTSLPAAGVGCAFKRQLLGEVAKLRKLTGPFAPTALTEDYELGLLVSELGGRSRFVRALDAQGQLIATRECFPDTVEAAIRQKARWLHGIAFQGWERIGWTRRPGEIWMRLRDRRGPLVVIVLLAAYLQIPLWALLLAAQAAGLHQPPPLNPALTAVVWVGTAGLLWRLFTRAAFTTVQYGWREGLRSLPRQLIGNYIAILAGRRAFADYTASLRGKPVVWDKTDHRHHPADLAERLL